MYNALKFKRQQKQQYQPLENDQPLDNPEEHRGAICLKILEKAKSSISSLSPKSSSSSSSSVSTSPKFKNNNNINNNQDKDKDNRDRDKSPLINRGQQQQIQNASKFKEEEEEVEDSNVILNRQPQSTDRKMKEMLMICIAGGTASGKTTVCEEIIKRLENQRVAVICLDSFYRPLAHEDLENVASYNFDHPDAFDWEYAQKAIKELKSGNKFHIPTYCFKTHTRLQETVAINGIDVIIFEGILSLYSQGIRDQMDIKIFVDTDSDTRLSRRVMRDIAERGRSLEGVLHQYEKFVKPSFDEYILPTKKYADVIIPRGADNVVAIDLIVQHIRSKLNEQDAKKLNANDKVMEND
ncbi:uridine kinase [Heterostelium album PN500]|uniref:Uridine-cytidine kinase n=1 Tax=Heterostelium pallidum (strain ATCC 26659 / Pp 5 / PN500) TaxID=670386 RepID=D3BJV1_HETP5|nr:uridine kinase [Heterostelium album PN500]EFA78181.1 uridine kinase [Heterostelium album PN500]|eukprot:XP_020430307.1 uridine kinase [Heterostelium album PN500]